MPERVLFLEARVAGSPYDQFALHGPEAFVGRSSRAEVELPCQTVSKRHARIRRTARGFVISDAESRNGTTVNGVDVTRARLLAEGDVIRVGTCELVVHLPERVSRTRSSGLRKRVSRRETLAPNPVHGDDWDSLD